MATYNSNLVAAGGGQAAPSVMPGTIKAVYGSVTIPASVTIGANDTMPLFYMSGGSPAHIVNYLIDTPALDSGALLTVSLLDSLATPTAFFTASTGFRAGSIITAATTLRASIGAAVGYTTQNLIFLRAIAGAGANVGGTPVVVYFTFEITKD